MKLESLAFGSKTIDYELSFSDRKTLGITVTPEMDVKVIAPDNTSLEKIREKVRKKAPWILKQTSYFLSFQPRTPQKRFVSGESHLYLGRQYKLKVHIGSKEEVRYKGRSIEITTSNKEHSEKLMNAWYRERAKIKFKDIATPSSTVLKNIKFPPMEFIYGICLNDGAVVLPMAK